jgi:hypothetical protein
MTALCTTITEPLDTENKSQIFCGSLLKNIEPCQKAIYDNFSGELLLCPTNPLYPICHAGRVGSHETCLRRYLNNKFPSAVATAEEVEIMYRSTRLQKGPAGVSLFMDSFAPTCEIQADRIGKAILEMEKRGLLENDDLLQVSLSGHNCQETISGSVSDVKHKLSAKM